MSHSQCVDIQDVGTYSDLGISALTSQVCLWNPYKSVSCTNHRVSCVRNEFRACRRFYSIIIRESQKLYCRELRRYFLLWMKAWWVLYAWMHRKQFHCHFCYIYRHRRKVTLAMGFIIDASFHGDIGKLRYSCTPLNLNASQRWASYFYTPIDLYLLKQPPSTQCIGDWPQHNEEEKDPLPLVGIESWLLSLQAHILVPILVGISYSFCLHGQWN